MKSIWKTEDLISILEQLDKKNAPFYKYRFTGIGEGLNLLGQGASALVFDAEKRKGRGSYAIKVIGFGDGRVDPNGFISSCYMQNELQNRSSNIVKMYDYVQLLVGIEGANTVTHVERYYSGKDLPDGDYLLLQFIVMEKLTPIIDFDERRKPHIVPTKLASFDQNEILKLSYDVGMALDEAHKMNVIHRDIKPENVFYCEKTGRYKLGDFGIAKTVYSGFASTCAFTKGYGAPEVVGTLEDKYDQTADIYSYGMMLYVLLNELRFPGSDNYRPNFDQYKSDFELPPIIGSDYRLFEAIKKMTEYDPDNRYQSMDQVLNDIERIIAGDSLKFKKVHLLTIPVMACAFALSGIVTWMLIPGSSINVEFPKLIYALFIACIFKLIMKVMKKSLVFPNLFIGGLAVVYAYNSEFTWWRLIMVLAMLFLDILPGATGIMIFAAKGTAFLSERFPDTLSGSAGMAWITVLLLSLAVFMIIQYPALDNRSFRITKILKNLNIYWFIAFLFYLTLIFVGLELSPPGSAYYQVMAGKFGENITQIIRSCELHKTGIAGCIFVILWIIREKVMSRGRLI